MENVKNIDIEGQTVMVCADTDNIRPYKPCVFFIHPQCDIKMVFERTEERNVCFGDTDWCNKMSIGLVEMVEKASELVKPDDNELF